MNYEEIKEYTDYNVHHPFATPAEMAWLTSTEEERMLQEPFLLAVFGERLLERMLRISNKVHHKEKSEADWEHGIADDIADMHPHWYRRVSGFQGPPIVKKYPYSLFLDIHGQPVRRAALKELDNEEKAKLFEAVIPGFVTVSYFRELAIAFSNYQIDVWNGGSEEDEDDDSMDAPTALNKIG